MLLTLNNQGDYFTDYDSEQVISNLVNDYILKVTFQTLVSTTITTGCPKGSCSFSLRITCFPFLYSLSVSLLVG